MDEHESLIYIKIINLQSNTRFNVQKEPRKTWLLPKSPLYSKAVVHVKYHWHPKKDKVIIIIVIIVETHIHLLGFYSFTYTKNKWWSLIK